MTEKRIRLVLCMGKTCNENGDAKPLYERMVERLGEPATFRSKEQVRWEIATCLSQCGSGPNLILFPEYKHYAHTNLKKIDAIVDEFIQLRTDATGAGDMTDKSIPR